MISLDDEKLNGSYKTAAITEPCGSTSKEFWYNIHRPEPRQHDIHKHNSDVLDLRTLAVWAFVKGDPSYCMVRVEKTSSGCGLAPRACPAGQAEAARLAHDVDDAQFCFSVCSEQLDGSC